MKKFFTLAFSVIIMFISNVLTANDSWIFEATVGPSIGINESGHNLLLEPRIGKKYIKAGMGFYLGNQVALRPHIAFDYPFFYTLDKTNDFIIGPTFDLGPSLNFKAASSIDFLVIGVGLKLSYIIDEDFGIIFVPIHMGMSFVRWVNGSGVDGVASINYNMKFGVYLNL